MDDNTFSTFKIDPESLGRELARTHDTAKGRAMVRRSLKECVEWLERLHDAWTEECAEV